MPTLGEACQQLRISRHTLDKWIGRINEGEEEKAEEERKIIVPQRHKSDYRFYTITDEDLQRIRDARAQMPGAQTGQKAAIIPSYSSLAFDRRQSDETAPGDRVPVVSPIPRQRLLQRERLRAAGDGGGMLPEGMMSRTDAADSHGIPRSTFRRWCESGQVETAQETFGGEHGTFPIAQPVTRAGLQRLYALASHRSDFQRCPQCPHDTSLDVSHQQ